MYAELFAQHLIQHKGYGFRQLDVGTLLQLMVHTRHSLIVMHAYSQRREKLCLLQIAVFAQTYLEIKRKGLDIGEVGLMFKPGW